MGDDHQRVVLNYGIKESGVQFVVDISMPMLLLWFVGLLAILGRYNGPSPWLVFTLFNTVRILLNLIRGLPNVLANISKKLLQSSISSNYNKMWL